MRYPTIMTKINFVTINYANLHVTFDLIQLQHNPFPKLDPFRSLLIHGMT